MLNKDIDALYLGGEIFQKGVSYEVASLSSIKTSDLYYVDLLTPSSRLRNLPTATEISELGTVTRRYNHDEPRDNGTGYYHVEEIVSYQPLFNLKNKVGKVFCVAHVILNHGNTDGGGYYTTETVGIIKN